MKLDDGAFVPRGYQLEMLEASLAGNIIIAVRYPLIYCYILIRLRWTLALERPQCKGTEQTRPNANMT